MAVTYKITIVATWPDDDDDPGASALLDVFNDSAAQMIGNHLGCDEPTVREEDGVTVEDIETPE